MHAYLENGVLESFANCDALSSLVVQTLDECDAFNCDDGFEGLNVQLPPCVDLIVEIFDHYLE
jgi:hypothetical protein